MTTGVFRGVTVRPGTGSYEIEDGRFVDPGPYKKADGKTIQPNEKRTVMEPVSKVYWLKGRSSAISQSILAKIELLFNLEEFNRLIIPDMGMAIKINMSEIGYHHYIPPVVISSIFERMRSLGAKPVVTDGCSLFKGSRFDGYDWMNTAVVQGFGTGEAFDNQIMLVGGYTNEEGNFFPSDGENLGGVELGSLLIDSGYLHGRFPRHGPSLCRTVRRHLQPGTGTFDRQRQAQGS